MRGGLGSVSCLAGSGRSESYRRGEIIDQIYPVGRVEKNKNARNLIG